jgi:serine/threonine protein kinase
MDELFRNVQKSSYIPIPQEYSLELADLIDMCLQKNAKYRPRASQLLEHDIISRFKNRKNNPID